MRMAKWGAAAAVSALSVVGLAPTANAGVVACLAVLVDDSAGQWVNCNLDTVGHCTVVYDPLIDGNSPVTETVEYVNCLS